MSELKTLKDMNTYSDDINYPTINDLISKEQLKAEAVKCVKFLECTIKECRVENCKNCIEDIGRIKAFKHFFNITEEDLE